MIAKGEIKEKDLVSKLVQDKLKNIFKEKPDFKSGKF